MGKILKVIGLIFVKLASLLPAIFFGGIFIFFVIIALIIDLIAYLRDKATLHDKEEIEKRKTDRTNSCLHSCLDLVVSYLKFLFLQW